MRLFPRLLPAGSLFASQRVHDSKRIEITIENDSKMSLGPGGERGGGEEWLFQSFCVTVRKFCPERISLVFTAWYPMVY